MVTHPPQTTDSFTLYIKAAILLGKVKSFNVRFKIRYSDGVPDVPNSYTSDQPFGYPPPSPPAPKGIDPRETAEFQILDNLLRNFTNSIPREFKDPVGAGGSRMDPVLYLAHLLPHV